MINTYDLIKWALLDFGHELPKSTDAGDDEENMRLYKVKYAKVIDMIFNQKKDEDVQLVADRRARLVQVLEDYLFELAWEDWESASDVSMELFIKDYFSRLEKIYSTPSVDIS